MIGRYKHKPEVRKDEKKINSRPAVKMRRGAENSVPILRELCQGGSHHQHTKSSGREEALVQKKRMNLKRSH